MTGAKKHALLLMLAILLAFCVIVPVSVFFNLQAGNKKMSSATVNYQANTSDLIIIQGNITSFDIPNQLVKIRFYVLPYGEYATQDSIGLFSRNVTVEFDSKTVVFTANKRADSQDVSFSLIGDPNYYPFDRYSVGNDVLFRAYYTDETGTVQAIPILFELLGAIVGYSTQSSIYNLVDNTLKEDGTLELVMDVSRSITTIIFSLFIVVLMWLLTFGAIALCISFVLLNKSELPIIIITVSLMFALPSVRNSQSGISAYGCTADVAGFFWNMALISLCAITLMATVFRRAFNGVDAESQPLEPNYKFDIESKFDDDSRFEKSSVESNNKFAF